MGAKAIVFGGIGTLVETSEHQRQAFNQAFREAGVPWAWDVPTYRALLAVPGGRARIRHYDKNHAQTGLSDEQIARLHTRKSELFQECLKPGTFRTRPGVMRLIEWSQRQNFRVGLASTTSSANIDALAAASGIDLGRFDVVLHAGLVEQPKPHPDIYLMCLESLGLSADEVVAIEDSPSGVAAAVGAGIDCIAVPGLYTRDLDFSGAAALAIFDDMDTFRAFLRDSDR